MPEYFKQGCLICHLIVAKWRHMAVYMLVNMYQVPAKLCWHLSNTNMIFAYQVMFQTEVRKKRENMELGILA